MSIGSAPGWKPGAVQRIYAVIQTGGSGTLALAKLHYLDSELNGNIEDNIVEWLYLFSSGDLLEQGRASFNVYDNWISIANVDMGLMSSYFGDVEIGIGESELTSLTWNGSVNTDWFQTDNWTPNGAPSDNTVITIPDAGTTTFDPTIPAIATCGTITLESGGVLNSDDGALLTINGAEGAWSNLGGTFNAGTGTVIFANGNESDTVTIAGTSNFYNLTVTDKTSVST